MPQGSILGLLLCLIYINDLASVCEHTMPILFADDTNLFINGDDLIGKAPISNTELENISHWLKVNILSFNVQKESLYDTYFKRTPQPNHVSTIEGHKIDEVKKIFFLVYLDDKINWKRHID